MVELVDTLALGASAARREGSSPFIRTKTWRLLLESFCFGLESLEASSVSEATEKVSPAR